MFFPCSLVVGFLLNLITKDNILHLSKTQKINPSIHWVYLLFMIFYTQNSIQYTIRANKPIQNSNEKEINHHKNNVIYDSSLYTSQLIFLCYKQGIYLFILYWWFCRFGFPYLKAICYILKERILHVFCCSILLIAWLEIKRACKDVE